MAHSFTPELEAAYQAELEPYKRTAGRESAWLAAALFVVFAWLDLHAIPSALGPVLFLRFGLIVPLLLWIVWFSGRPQFIAHYRAVMLFEYFCMGAAIEAMVWLAEPGEVAQETYYSGLILVVFALYTWTYLNVYETSLIGALLIVSYAIIAVSTARETNPHFWIALLSNMFFLVSSGLIGLFGAINRDRNLRTLFLTQRTLREEVAAKEAANCAKNEFFANMSHEIRTPMNAILGLNRLIQRDLTDPVQIGRSQRLDGSAQHLLRLINDILDLAKIEAGKMRLSPQPFCLDQVLDSVAAMVQPLLVQKPRIAFRIETAERDTHWWGDAIRLAQMMLNFLGNAIKFTDRGGITLRIATTPLEGARARLRCEVEDTGCGIAFDRQVAIFEAFEQADSADSGRHGGTGLGLNINRRLVALMDGRIGVESQPGHGSRFWFEVPLERLSEEARPAARDEGELDWLEGRLRQQALGRRLLLADDNAISREVVGELLRPLGFQVTEAVDGQAAVAAARVHAFDGILMDMRMPRLDGLEATRTIRRLAPARPPFIVALTANAFDEDREAARAAGMEAFLAKPIDPEKLFATLLRLLPASMPAVDPSVPPAVADGPVDPAAAPSSPLDPPASSPKTEGTASDAAIADRLATIPGLDTLQGFQLLKPARYFQYLEKFCQDHGDAIDQIQAALRAGDRTAAARQAHSLKGVAATLGIRSIASCSTALEHALRDQSATLPLEPLIAQCAARLEQMIAALRQALAASDEDP